jgi:single-strand DNA-binding protein
MYFNKVIIVGRLVREPENIMLPSGTQLSNLVIAYNRNYKDQSGQWKEESHFFEVKVFGNLSVRVVPQLSKGDLVLIEGRLHQDKWLDKESGEPRSKIRIVALDIKLLSKAGSKLQQTATPMSEEPELPSFEEGDLLPEGDKGKGDDLESLLFEDENPKKEDKKDDLDDLDDLFL